MVIRACTTILLLACIFVGLGLGSAKGVQFRSRADKSIVDSMIPDTTVGRQLAGWLKAYDSGDIDVVRRFVAEHYDKAKLQKGPNPVDFFFVPVFAETRALEFHRILYINEQKVIALAQSSLTGEWYTITVRVAEAPPYGMYIQGIFRVQVPEDTRPYGKLSDAEVVRQFRPFLSKLVAADAFSGTVLLAKDGKTLLKNAYGPSNKEQHEANRLSTKFQLASLSKIFTGVSICQLAEQGKLSFDDLISKHLPDYPNRAVADKITIRHLLTHTSGLGDFLDKKEYQVAEAHLKHPKDFFPFFANDPLAFEPGEDEAYSNAGFMILGAIIEEASRQSFLSYVKEHIFKPAGMISSGYNETGEEIPDLAVAYRNGGWDPQYKISQDGFPLTRKSVSQRGGQGSAVGGGYSTIEDLSKFAAALRSHKLLGPAYTRLVFTGTGQLGEPGIVPIDEAYGFHYDIVNQKHIVGHNGGAPGVSTRLDIYADQGYTVIVLSNYDSPMGSIVANKARELITRDVRPKQPRLEGEFRMHKNFHSRFLPLDRDVAVYLPPSYEVDRSRRYPVLYMHDGQDLFGKGWRLEETAKSLIKSGVIEPLIIVGINNTGEYYRYDEYTPTFGPVIGAGGKADLYGRMMVEELKPFIDSQYRTLTGAANTGLGGSSLGGLVSLYVGLKYPTVFGRLAVVSPSVWWNNKVILRDVEGATNNPALRIWLDCGTAEGGRQTIRDTRLLRDSLIAKGWILDDNLKYLEAKGAVHDHDAWARRAGLILTYLFPKK